MSERNESPDPLRPTAAAAADAWAARVRAGREQLERLREAQEPTDFYRPMAKRFGMDPARTGEAALDVLRGMARPGQVWLDIGAGGGRYALPLALAVDQVIAVEPAPSMLEVLRAGMREHGITNVQVVEGYWPTDVALHADVALMAHVGYDIGGFAACLDAAEVAADRCVVIMRSSATQRASFALWPQIHGEARLAYPMLPELLTLLVARGTVPEVNLVEREMWGYGDREQLLAAHRRMLGLRVDSDKDRLLQRLVAVHATERDGQWEVDWSPMHDGIVSWQSPA